MKVSSISLSASVMPGTMLIIARVYGAASGGTTGIG
jgi:hypothetical protein